MRPFVMISSVATDFAKIAGALIGRSITTGNASWPEVPPLRHTQRCDEPRRKNRHIHWGLTNVVAVRPQKGPPLESLSRRHIGRNENIAQRRPKTYSEICRRAQTP